MRKNGYSLIELVVTMGIVAILAAIAIPSYTAYTKRANRTDATRSMTLEAQSLERCYSQYFAYTNVNCAVAAGNSTSLQGFYALVLTVIVAAPTVSPSYTIVATPLLSPQTTDSSCQSFTLNSAGKQGAMDTGLSDTTKTCWGST